MSKFIKCTGATDNKEIYINTDYIISFYKEENITKVICSFSTDEAGYLVKEAPETIKNMIECY